MEANAGPAQLPAMHQELTCAPGQPDTGPVLTLNGAETTATQCFMPSDDPTDPGVDVEVDPDPYVDPGATALDACDGDLSASVVTSGSINKGLPGVYTLQYDVRDSAYNWAEPITRTVEVIDSLAPKLIHNPAISLWPPTQAMGLFSLSQCAFGWDLCDGYLNLDDNTYIVAVTSNDPGNDANDISVINNSQFAVRARRNADGSARVYTVLFYLVDSSLNETQGSCTVTVP